MNCDFIPVEGLADAWKCSKCNQPIIRNVTRLPIYRNCGVTSNQPGEPVKRPCGSCGQRSAEALRRKAENEAARQRAHQQALQGTIDNLKKEQPG